MSMSLAVRTSNTTSCSRKVRAAVCTSLTCEAASAELRSTSRAMTAALGTSSCSSESRAAYGTNLPIRDVRSSSLSSDKRTTYAHFDPGRVKTPMREVDTSFLKAFYSLAMPRSPSWHHCTCGHLLLVVQRASFHTAWTRRRHSGHRINSNATRSI